MYKDIDVYEYMNELLKKLRTGILITTKSNEKVNTMTISWGHIGIEWNKLSFIAYVRGSRYTYDMLDCNSFTINVPLDDDCKEILKYCGSESGRKVDKIKDLNLTPIKTRTIDGVGLKELPLTLECKVIYKQFQDKSKICDNIKDKFYPKGLSDIDNYHTMFYGEITDAYIIED